MKFLLIALCLSLERFLPMERVLQREKFFNSYFNFLGHYIPISWQAQHYKLMLSLLPPALCIPALCWLSYHLQYILGFSLESTVLLYCLGSSSIYASVLSKDSDLFIRAYTALFNVLFWFALLGSSGALLYRLLERISHSEHSWLDEFTITTANNLFATMAWLPIRFFGFMQALVGTFSNTADYWLDHVLTGLEYNDQFAAGVGRVALGLPVAAELDDKQKTNALQLIDRVLLFFLILVLVAACLNLVT